jgi:hypothetical protein
VCSNKTQYDILRFKIYLELKLSKFRLTSGGNPASFLIMMETEPSGSLNVPVLLRMPGFPSQTTTSREQVEVNAMLFG